jgi:hypothetical protein
MATAKIKRQLLMPGELETKNIKDELLRTAWFGGSLDREGKETIFSMIRDDGPISAISYKEIIPNSLSGFKSFNTNDIFCAVSLKYDYDIGSGEYLKEISVKDIGTDSPQIAGNNNLTPTQKNMILGKCKSLHDRYGIINDPPTNLTENKWLYRDIDAYDYLLNWLDWMGEGREGTKFERYDITFALPLGLAIEKDIDAGCKILIEIPHAGGEFAGIITKAQYSLNKGSEQVQCDAFIKMPLALNDITDIGETGSAEIDIDESGERTDEINETGNAGSQ